MSDSSSFSQMIVVGSSAGGIEALSTLVHTLPPDLTAPVVVAQHLDPSRESRLGEILSHSSTLPVRTLSDYQRLEPGVVYVVPANLDIEITDHDIRLLPGTHRSRPSIDLLFASAAEIFREDLIAVVLTGTGSDGAAGALEVRQAGGTVIIQDPVTASFPAMPRSLAPSAVDFVIPLEEIGPLLQGLLNRTHPVETPDEEDALNGLLRLLRDRHDIDFRTYKRATILRRVQRRMAATNSPTIADYLRYVQQTPEEQRALIASFLIKVTKFFRDRDLFDVLRTQILPDIIETARRRDHIIRFWSAGTATGEEAYSLAILLAELLGDELERFHVRIFATDLDPDAITFARQGIYSHASLSDLDAETRDRYFDHMDGGYQISKRIRALMVFGQHDLADRAPFPRVDLILCRNVLIYFTMELQRRILQLFAFSLRDGGYLVLGKSETVTPFAEPFVADNSRLKSYRRRGDRPVIPAAPIREIVPPVSPRIAPARPSLYGRALSPQPTAPSEQPFGLRTDSILFDLSVGVVVVDRRYDIQYINEVARTLLGIHSSALGEDLIHLVQTVASAELRALIDRAMTEGTQTSRTLAMVDETSDEGRYLDVTCKANSEDGGASTVTISVLDGTGRVDERRHLQEELEQARWASARGEQQRQHLDETNRDLLTTNQQLTREMAELRSQNEEFLVGNEEMQAAAEEVETLNEELQATNEELETLNEELQATVEELNTTNDDLQTRTVEIQDLAVRLESARALGQTVLNTLGDAIVVVDGSGRTVLTNSKYDQLFSAPLDTLEVGDADGSPFPHDELPARRAARGESFQVSVSIPSTDGTASRYEIAALPVGDGRDGAGGVLVIRDLDKSRTQR